LTHARSPIARAFAAIPNPLQILSNNMLQRDGTTHRRLRRVVDGPFRRAAIDALRPRIEQLTDRALDRLATSKTPDFVPCVARDLPLAVICELLGIPAHDRPQIERWMARIGAAGSPIGFLRALPALRGLSGYLAAHFDAYTPRGSDDLTTLLLSGDADPPLTKDERLATCFLLFVAGHETTTHLLSGSVLALAAQPEEVDDHFSPFREASDGAAAGAARIDELLRHVSPVMFAKPRIATSDLEIAGKAVPQGTTILPLLVAGNRDPVIFDAPDEIRFHRAPPRHLGLGAGPHFCLGAWLARLEADIVLTRFAARYRRIALAVPRRHMRYAKASGMRALTALPFVLD
ncbi:MAG: cytochrome P450, partial [Pseudomonadota bacterium]